MFYRRQYALVSLLLLMMFTAGLPGQTIVSTSPEDRRAVLEEFGGMYCVYCPHGHQIIEDLSETLADDLVLINYQSGPYAVPIGNDPDLGNDYSAALQDLCQLSGYPAATVNRHVFPGLEQNIPGTTALGRVNWGAAIDDILQESAPVNIAAEANLNISTRQLELYIEYYYTADVDVESNRLNVAILQNNVQAPQHGGDQGNYYLHQHLFREFITGQWGHIISNTSAGTFGSLTYNLTLPEYYRDIWVDPVNIELAIFIGEGEQEILNGIQVEPELSSSFASDANLIAIQAPDDICGSALQASAHFRNDGNLPLESCVINYGINGGSTDSFTWEGHLEPLEEVIIDLPAMPVFGGGSAQDFFVELIDPNNTPDPSTYNNRREHHFTVAPTTSINYFELAIRTDDFGYELYWEVVDENGTVHASGGNEIVGQTNGGAQIATPSDPGAYGNNIFIVEDFFLPFDGCYELRVLDDYADGMCCFYGNGFYRLREPGASPLIQGGEFGAIDASHFTINSLVNSSELSTPEKNTAQVYPNPASTGNELQFRWSVAPPATYQWQLLHTGGSLIASGDQSTKPNTASLAAGFYHIRLQYEEEIQVLPVVITR